MKKLLSIVLGVLLGPSVVYASEIDEFMKGSFISLIIMLLEIRLQRLYSI